MAIGGKPQLAGENFHHRPSHAVTRFTPEETLRFIALAYITGALSAGLFYKFVVDSE